MAREPDTGAIALAERILTVLDDGRRTTTYKLAVLAALMDLCLESADREGEVRDTFTTRQLAEKVIDLYWPQTTDYTLDDGPPRLLKQGGSGQATILTAIATFRGTLGASRLAPLSRIRRAKSDAWERLVRDVEWTLIEMPLPKLQNLGPTRDTFLYEIGWNDDVRVSRREVTAYQWGSASAFDNRIRLRPGVGDSLVRLQGLLRPLLHRKWVEMVVRLNHLEERRVEEFLFGAQRIDLTPVRDGLLGLHDGRCFYCDGRVGATNAAAVAIDHFVPWSRHADNAIENLVPAHSACNGHKSDFLAARTHVEKWRDRMERQHDALGRVAREAGFENASERVLNVARGIYFRLPIDAQLWERKRKFERVGPEPLTQLFRPIRAA